VSGRLAGKVAVVIGAGSSGVGISNGRAVAIAYAREGAAVLAVDLNGASAEETARMISEAGGAARGFRADATRLDEVEAAMAFAAEAFGGIDIVHNNVGVASMEPAAIEDYAVEAWDREIAVTLKSAFLGMRAAFPRLRAQGGGVIVNTSSIAAVRSLTRGAAIAYTAAKGGVEAMTRQAAAEYGPQNIRVNCLRIGYADTPLIRNSFEAAGITGATLEERMREGGVGVPLRGERTSVWDVAAAAVFLASDEARHITGVILNVDGGLEVAPI
jgi:NAD(P)-dependent dehydrogenase (short-subunit alcohol dehydrogenase family)